MICVIDYGVGNIQAFMNLFKRLQVPAKRVNDPKGLVGCSRIILPGVGHFDHAMQRLNDSGLRPILEQLVVEEKVPVMGVCVGMQMLSDGSDEGVLPGLGWVPGIVRAMRNNPIFEDFALPHMGWNSLSIHQDSVLFKEVCDEPPQFYFLHSYYFDAHNREDVVATAHYGADFDAVVSRGNIHGVQCHPEKSHHWGEHLLKNFVGIK
jgi:glutamine amidotransferase